MKDGKVIGTLSLRANKMDKQGKLFQYVFLAIKLNDVFVQVFYPLAF